jgi:hypothetical protein
MNPKYLPELRQFKKAARLRSWAIYRSVIGRLCQANIATDKPWASKILGLIRNQDIRGLVDYADFLSEQQYADAELHFSANQFASLIRKYPFPSSLADFQPKLKAREKWLLAEAQCLDTNRRFLDGSTYHYEESLHRMRGFIRYVIGETPSLTRIFRRSEFGPGASIGVHGNATNRARKIASNWSVNPRALNHAYAAVSQNWHLVEIFLPHNDAGFWCLDPEAVRKQFLDRIRYVHHNKIAFVPKTVKVERPIAVEPLLNGFVQKGIDLEMRDLLKSKGIDLTDQEPNQRFAREGSINDSLESFVTIDLSSASDSIATEVVRALIPFDWFRLLDATRSEQYRDEDGVNHLYHKFCSMGNGFCFPLETLIFAAVCSACGCGTPGQDFLVYGDDIVVRKKYAGAVLSLLGVLGFTANNGKTFLEGPFRESCGSDWFGGEDVRPFTLDFSLDSLESFFKFLNLSERNRRSTTFFAPIRDFIISNIPRRLRFCRPMDSENSDTGYRVAMDQFIASPYALWSKDLQCWSWLELIHTPVSDNWRDLQDASSSHVYAALSGASSSQPFTVRRKTKTNVRRVAHG